MNKKSPKPARQIEIAKKRISFLFNLAKNDFPNNKASANDHIKLARRIAMKYKVKFTPFQKKSFCKNCISYIVPGKNSRVRIHKSRLIYYCLECRKYIRHPLK